MTSLKYGRGRYGDILDVLIEAEKEAEQDDREFAGLKPEQIGKRLEQEGKLSKKSSQGEGIYPKKLGRQLWDLQREGLIEKPWEKRYSITLRGENTRNMVKAEKTHKEAEKLEHQLQKLRPRVKEEIKRVKPMKK